MSRPPSPTAHLQYSGVTAWEEALLSTLTNTLQTGKRKRRKKMKHQFNAPVSFFLFLNALQHFGSDFTEFGPDWEERFW
jgi:hypothetical protein